MKILATFAAALLLLPSALAQHQNFAIDSNASQVKMTLNTTHEVVNGTFHIQSGSIDFDPSTSHISGSIVVAAASGNTGNVHRDKRMNTSILNIGQYTTISFEPRSYAGTIATTGDSTIQVTGIFTLLGTPHPITVPVLVHLDPTVAFVKSHFMLPYVQWGLKNPSFLIWKADNDVAIDLYLTGRLSR